MGVLGIRYLTRALMIYMLILNRQAFNFTFRKSLRNCGCLSNGVYQRLFWHWLGDFWAQRQTEPIIWNVTLEYEFLITRYAFACIRVTRRFNSAGDHPASSQTAKEVVIEFSLIHIKILAIYNSINLDRIKYKSQGWRIIFAWSCTVTCYITIFNYIYNYI